MDDNLYDFESVSKNINSVLHDDLGKKNDRCLELYTEPIKVYTEIDSSFINHCNKSVKYLKYLEDYYEGNINAAKAIIYVYCWLYDNELHKEKYNNSRLNIYKKLLKEYPVIDSMSNIPTIFQTYLKNSIDENLKNLYELYYKFDKFINEKECKGSNCKCAEECYDSYNSYIKGCNKSDNVNFCNGLEKFRAQYNNYMSDGSKCNGNYKYLPPAISFGISVILIPLIATLIISSLLFVLYKFTPLGSWMCPRSKHKYKMKENIGEQMYDTIHRSGINNNSLIKNPYTISYHSMEHS